MPSGKRKTPVATQPSAAPLYRAAPTDLSMTEEPEKDPGDGLTSESPLVEERHADVVSELASLVGRPLIKIRKRGELLSVIDVIQCLTGFEKQNAGSTLRDLCVKHPGIKTIFCKFTGRGQQPTPCANVKLLLEIVNLLPCKCIDAIRPRLPEIIARYVGDTPVDLSANELDDGVPGGPLNEEQPAGVLAELSMLVGRPVIKIRKHGELLSVIDVIESMTGFKKDTAAYTLKELCTKYPEIQTTLHKFPGARQRPTHCADIKLIIKIIILLPCKSITGIRSKAAELIVRYVGGDLTLVAEVERNNELQQELSGFPDSEKTPEQLLAGACAESVRVNSLPQKPVELSISTRCLDNLGEHLYVLKIPSKHAIRPGRTKDLDARLQQHRRDFGYDAHIVLYAPNCGHVEKTLHRHLKPWRINPSCELIEASRVSIDDLSNLVVELHTRACESAHSSSSSGSRKRSYEEAQLDLDVAELDAKTSLALDERKLHLKKLEHELNKDEYQLSKNAFILELARAGDEAAIAHILKT